MGIAGEPVRYTEGIHRRKVEYDAGSRINRTAFFREDGNLTLSRP